MIITRAKAQETLLVIATGVLVVHFNFEVPYLVEAALVLGLIGIFIPPLARLITRGWFKLADALGFVTSHVILSVVFFLLLSPISLLRRLFGGDQLGLRRPDSESAFTTRDHTYEARDLQNPW